MTFFILLILFLLFIILRPFWKGYMMFRRYKQTVRSAFGEDPFANARQNRQGQRQHAPQRHHQRKVFTKDMGEYVSYEEMTDVSPSAKASASTQSEKSYHASEEQQITDAEWEDIPR